MPVYVLSGLTTLLFLHDMLPPSLETLVFVAPGSDVMVKNLIVANGSSSPFGGMVVSAANQERR